MKCHWLTVSDSKLRHQMDKCLCGESFLDLEEHYARMGGYYKSLMKFENGKWTRINKRKQK